MENSRIIYIRNPLLTIRKPRVGWRNFLSNMNTELNNLRDNASVFFSPFLAFWCYASNFSWTKGWDSSVCLWNTHFHNLIIFCKYHFDLSFEIRTILTVVYTSDKAQCLCKEDSFWKDNLSEPDFGVHALLSRYYSSRWWWKMCTRQDISIAA